MLLYFPRLLRTSLIGQSGSAKCYIRILSQVYALGSRGGGLCGQHSVEYSNIVLSLCPFLVSCQLRVVTQRELITKYFGFSVFSVFFCSYHLSSSLSFFYSSSSSSPISFPRHPAFSPLRRPLARTVIIAVHHGTGRFDSQLCSFRPLF